MQGQSNGHTVNHSLSFGKLNGETRYGATDKIGSSHEDSSSKELESGSGSDASPVAGGGTRHGISVLVATLFIAGENAGCGLLALPAAMLGTGWFGVPMILFCALMAGYAGLSLSKCWIMLEQRWPQDYAKVRYREPYGAIGFRCFGPYMRVAVFVCIQITLIGSVVVQLLLCADMVASLVSGTTGICFCIWIVIISAILTPFTWFGSPAEFWGIAAGAIGTTSVAVVCIVYQLIADRMSGFSPASVVYPAPSLPKTFLAFGTFLFAHGGTAGFPTFQNDMKRRERFGRSVIAGFIILVVLYVPTMVSGYVVFGNELQDNVTLNISHGVARSIAQICLICHLFCSCLICINPPLQEAEDLLKLPRVFGPTRVLFRTFVCIIILFIGLTIPQFSKLLDLLGGSSIACLTFIFPPLFYMKLKWDERYELKPDSYGSIGSGSAVSEKMSGLCHVPQVKSPFSVPLWQLIVFGVIVAVGVVGGIACTYQAVAVIVDPNALTLPCYVDFAYKCR